MNWIVKADLPTPSLAHDTSGHSHPLAVSQVQTDHHHQQRRACTLARTGPKLNLVNWDSNRLDEDVPWTCLHLNERQIEHSKARRGGEGVGSEREEWSGLLIVCSCSQRQPRISIKVAEQTSVNKHMDPAKARENPAQERQRITFEPIPDAVVNAQRKTGTVPMALLHVCYTHRYNHNTSQDYHRLLKNLAIPVPSPASPFCFLFFLGLAVAFESCRSGRSSSDGILDRSCAK